MMRELRRAACLGAAGACAMLLMLLYAAWHGDFRAEGYRMMEMPWSWAALADVYVGLSLFCGWVFFRERSLLAATAWTFVIFFAGNFASCCYVLWSVATSGDDRARFWMGENHEI